MAAVSLTMKKTMNAARMALSRKMKASCSQLPSLLGNAASSTPSTPCRFGEHSS